MVVLWDLMAGWWFGSGLFFHSVGNVIIPTDEFHVFLGLKPPTKYSPSKTRMQKCGRCVHGTAVLSQLTQFQAPENSTSEDARLGRWRGWWFPASDVVLLGQGGRQPKTILHDSLDGLDPANPPSNIKMSGQEMQVPEPAPAPWPLTRHSVVCQASSVQLNVMAFTQDNWSICRGTGSQFSFFSGCPAWQ